MSPILVRPVREQLEHDRVIRLLQAKYSRKVDVAINLGNEQAAPVTAGPWPRYPDLVIQSTDRRPRLLGTVEVETAESVNNLEAMSQWATFARFRAPFHLYVPVSSVDRAKRICADLRISVAEIWAYNTVGNEILFTLVHQSAAGKPRAAGALRATSRVKRPAVSSRERSGRRAVKSKAGSKVRKRAGKNVGESAAERARKSTRKRGVKQPSVRAPGTAKAAKVRKSPRVTKKASRSSRLKKR